ncbi:MAG TPA: YXWGXW repeat-containing protein [Parafilimonas sp.]|nr:YXWGXW repeat-containing protein [Parafilimonas sp.]
MKKLFFLLALMIGMATFSGCGPTRYTVTEQPAAPYYARPASPGVGYVWVDGDWYWRGGKYAYRNGHWVRPRGHRVWVAGTWVHSGRGYYWRKGHWK